ncbi:TPA: glycerol kinase [Candidatus Poribacteria bacterium]|nr:glycerol kinase [Candidatus Poribacteria bacterium]MBD71950.1 glycerol kinase [Candidatus Poribacteria bacterium]HCK16680.1 glycerol kinase [Candidatus Poribacteria bacterium]
MQTGYILSIDQGTTGTTILLMDAEGEIVGKESREFTQYYPKPGWVEHDAIEIWEVTCQVVVDLVSAYNAKNQIIAIGVTNQRETTVIWDRRTGNPIHPAIVWQCRRTSEICSDLKKQGLEEKIKSKTGLVTDPYFSSTKVLWILDQVDNARSLADQGYLAFGTIDSWLLWNLTDGTSHATDQTNASRTMLFNINTLQWDEELLEIFQVPVSILPEVQPSSNIFGTTKGLEFLPDSIPISGMAGDQQAALFGQLCTQSGVAKNTYGTGCFLLLNTGDQPIQSESGLLTTLACSLDQKPTYALEGSVFIAGAAIQWLRDELHFVDSAAETEVLAESLNDSDGVFVVPAFTGLGAPYWDPNAKGAILGLTRGTTPSHIVRASLESIAFQSADLVEAMIYDAGLQLHQLRVDGGAASNNFLMQFQADLLGVDIERPRHIETTAIGAAYLAGLGVGLWGNIDELELHRQVDRVFSPQMSELQRQDKLSAWRNAVKRVLSS